MLALLQHCRPERQQFLGRQKSRDSSTVKFSLNYCSELYTSAGLHIGPTVIMQMLEHLTQKCLRCLRLLREIWQQVSEERLNHSVTKLASPLMRHNHIMQMNLLHIHTRSRGNVNKRAFINLPIFAYAIPLGLDLSYLCRCHLAARSCNKKFLSYAFILV